MKKPQNVPNLYGIHVANIILEQQPEVIVNLYIQDSFKRSPNNTDNINNERINNITNLANQYGLSINYLPKIKLDELAGNLQHQGVVIQCKANTILKVRGEDELKSFYQDKLDADSNYKAFILILDGIQDPHNLGACIRSAEALGVDCVVIPQNNSVGLNSTVCKISSGAALLLPVFQVINLSRTITWLKEQGVWVYGTEMVSDIRLSDLDLKGSTALVMGAEGTGMRKLTSSLCDQIFTIPMVGTTESLNVSVATGICLYEVIRQRG